MTIKQARAFERRLIRQGSLLHQKRVEFVKKVQEFRRSGAWAITPEHHRTFAMWCKFAAPKMKLGFTTLQAYGSPNYNFHTKTHIHKWQKGSLTIFPKDAKIVRKAIVIYCQQNGLLLRHTPGAGAYSKNIRELKITRSSVVASICKEFINVANLDRKIRKPFALTVQ